MDITFDNYKIDLLSTSEGEAFFDLIDTNRARLEDFFAGTVSKTRTLKDTLEYCVEIENRIKVKSYFPYMITDVYTGQFVGLVDVKNIDWNVPKAELGSFIDSRYEGEGIVSKATNLVVNHIVKEYKFIKLLCRANTRNKGSIAVILKNGFELEGTIRRDYKTTKGEIVDLNYYGKVFD
ncbi:GNAT family N-acetyltransferase [Winogradskyella sp. PG-2]|uniref:GNAT family N-acetyltransferase n=1 Tax=Winogradskyella sp. PG-2 TaxID=754409 RepID=UPI0004587FC3|nr:GNAT family protein [Winogradskyella sp. PG-2]BAO77003.1 ribosomal-protein-L7p-serine acetyltransferase [Winogradskyella sp. PG-2]